MTFPRVVLINQLPYWLFLVPRPLKVSIEKQHSQASELPFSLTLFDLSICQLSKEAGTFQPAKEVNPVMLETKTKKNEARQALPSPVKYA